MLIASLVPGASYTSGTFTIPLSALTTSSGLTITASDSVEKLVYALLQTMSVKAIAGTLTQVNAGVEVSSRSSTSSVWETSTNNFAPITLVSFLTSLAFNTGQGAELSSNQTILTG